MTDEREEAMQAFLRAFDERLAAPAPLVDRRREDRRGAWQHLIDAAHVSGPADRDFVYWTESAVA
jgi:hypothetical protein